MVNRFHKGTKTIQWTENGIFNKWLKIQNGSQI